MKKVLLFGLAMAVTVATVPLFAAFEAHVINVTAQIENALTVNTAPIDFGTVFPQEHLLSRVIEIGPTTAFAENDRLAKTNYVIKQKPKVKSGDPYLVINPSVYSADPSYNQQVGVVSHEYCLNQYAELVDPTNLSDEYYTYCYPSLCPYLSKEKSLLDPIGPPIPADENGPSNTPWALRDFDLDYGVTAFHDPFSQDFWANGQIGRNGIDWWIIDLAVPCFAGECAQDWATFVNSINPSADPSQYVLPAVYRGETMGCDVWIEVNGFIPVPQA